MHERATIPPSRLPGARDGDHGRALDADSSADRAPDTDAYVAAVSGDVPSGDALLAGELRCVRGVLMSLEQIIGAALFVVGCVAACGGVLNYLAMQRELRLQKRFEQAENMLLYPYSYAKAITQMAKEQGERGAESHYYSKFEERRGEMDAWWNTRGTELARKVADDAIAAQREDDRRRRIAQDIWKHLPPEESPLAAEAWEVIVGKKQ